MAGGMAVLSIFRMVTRYGNHGNELLRVRQHSLKIQNLVYPPHI